MTEHLPLLLRIDLEDRAMNGDQPELLEFLLSRCFGCSRKLDRAEEADTANVHGLCAECQRRRPWRLN